MSVDVISYGLEYEVECLAASQRVHDKEVIKKRLLEINRLIVPRTSARAERIYGKLSDVFGMLSD